MRFCRGRFMTKRRCALATFVASFVATALFVNHVINVDFDFTMVTDPRAYPREGIGKTITSAKGLQRLTFNTVGCNNQSYDAIVVVNSAVANFERRRIIRETTGKVCDVMNCKLVFIVGASTNHSVMTNVTKEHERHKDLVVSWKEDVYKSVVNKAVTMLDWTAHRCPQASYIVRCDDDTYINVKNFLTDINNACGLEFNCFLCMVISNAHPRRDLKSKWHVSKQAYPAEVYPSYCAGAAFAFPNALSPALLSAVYKAPYNWNEDVWLTGLVRSCANVTIARTTYYTSLYDAITIDPSAIMDYLFIHNVAVTDFPILHNYFMATFRHHRPELIPKYFLMGLYGSCALLFVLPLLYINFKRRNKTKPPI